MKEGVDHINAYSKSSLEIGRFYSNFYYSPISLPEGVFDSIEAYWYWILTGGKSDKNVAGFKAKELGKKLPKVQEIDCDKIKHALDIK